MSDGDVSHGDPHGSGTGSDDQSSVNTGRRYFLIGATSTVAGLGVVGAAVPFVKYWSPSAKARALGAPVKIDFSKLQPGEMLSPIQAWRGKPVFLLYRDEATVAALEENPNDLADPDSDGAMQPDYAKNATRSTRPEIGIYIGICTHLGCSPQYVVVDNFADSGTGGFFCACHGSKFDLAGRVGTGFPAPDNLEVPPHRFVSDTVVIIGEEEGAS